MHACTYEDKVIVHTRLSSLAQPTFISTGKADAQVLFDVKSGRLMEKPDGCDETLFRMITGCWRWNPDDRSTFQELKWNLGGFFHAGQNLYSNR